MGTSSVPCESIPSLEQRIRRCNAEAIARTGDVNPAAVAEMLERALADVRTRQSTLLELAILLSTYLDDGIPPVL